MKLVLKLIAFCLLLLGPVKAWCQGINGLGGGSESSYSPEERREEILKKGITKLYADLQDPMYGEQRSTILLSRLAELGFEDFLIFEIVMGEASVVLELMKNGYIDATKIRGVERINLIYYSALTYHELLVRIFIDRRPIQEAAMREVSLLRQDAESAPHWDMDTILGSLDEKFRHEWGVLKLKVPKKYSEVESSFFGPEDMDRTNDAKYGGDITTIFSELLKAGATPQDIHWNISAQLFRALVETDYPNKKVMDKEFLLQRLRWFLMNHDQFLDFRGFMRKQKILSEPGTEHLRGLPPADAEERLSDEQLMAWDDYFTGKHLNEFREKIDLLGPKATILLTSSEFQEALAMEYAKSREHVDERFFDQLIELLRHAYGIEIERKLLQEAIDRHLTDLANNKFDKERKAQFLRNSVARVRKNPDLLEDLNIMFLKGFFDIETVIRYAEELGINYKIDNRGQMVKLELLPLEGPTTTAADANLTREKNAQSTGEEGPRERERRSRRRFRW